VETRQLRLAIEGRDGPIWELDFTPDGSTILAGVFKKVVNRWDSTTGKPKGTAEGWHHSDKAAATSVFGETTLALSRGFGGRI
jgi:hypothetical protein